MNVADFIDKEKLNTILNKPNPLDKKNIITDIVNRKIKDEIIIPNVPGYILVLRKNVEFKPKPNNDIKEFYVLYISNDGDIRHGMCTITGLYNLDKTLGRAIAKSFIPGTFKFEILKFENEKLNDQGYVIW